MFNIVPEAPKRHGCQFYVALFKCIFIVLTISIPLSKLLMHALVKKIKNKIVNNCLFHRTNKGGVS